MSPARDDDRLQRILATVDAIPAGCVASYVQVATLAGLPRRARMVGHALRGLPDGTELPWHRVVGADGRLHTSGKSAREQSRRLRSEGIEFRPSGTIDLARFRFREG